ncbi:MAG: hypothetical protein IT258_02795 [Saprospiraceae bacterium]|nr:hypothetical protein [Saprospiraceae bacterium]
MKKLIPLLFLLLSMGFASLNAQSFQHSWGFSYNWLQYQTYTFTQYSITRPPHLVTGPAENDWLFTMRYNPRWALGKAEAARKMNLEINVPFDMGLFFTTDEYQKKGNYFAMHLPVMLGLAFGEGSRPTVASKSHFGGFVAGGASLNVFSGALGKKQYLTPCASIGLRTILENRAKARKRLIELSYTIGLVTDKKNVNIFDGGIEVPRIQKFYLREVLKYSQNLVSLSFTFRNKSKSE